jgi:hypothetical protein
MKLIVPCCGSSKRFPNLPPKWMLPDHTGRPMICAAVSLLQYDPDDLIVSILREHEEKFAVTAGLRAAFGRDVAVNIIEDRTRNQSETVARTIEQMGIKGPVFVKDSDNCYALDDLEQDSNYVCYDSLNNHDLINPKNKSYLQLDAKGTLLNIREKVVISDTFSVGGYYFADADNFLSYYHRLSEQSTHWEKELYPSDIISAMILDGQSFKGRAVSHYQDWGTIQDWTRILLHSKAYFVQLDGFLFERGSEHFEPRFEKTHPYPAAVELIKQLLQQGHSVQFLSIRPDKFADLTRKQLAAIQLDAIPVTYNCPVSRWEMVTAPYHGIPFRTSEAYELDPQNNCLLDKLTQ